MKISQKRLNREERIHEMRVMVKRLRAILRLIESVDKGTTPTLSHDLKKISDRLSASRDETVCAAWLNDHALKTSVKLSEPRIGLVTLGRALAHDQKRVTRLAHRRLMSIPLQKHALRISVRRMLKSRRKALKRGSGEAYHLWRKRVKDLQYQLEFLEIPQFRSRLRKLGQFLGQAHDCELVAHFVTSHHLACRHKAKKIANHEKNSFQGRAEKIRLPRKLRDGRVLPY